MVDIDLISKYIAKGGFGVKSRTYFQNKIILVTGGAGAIGSNLVNILSYLVGEKGKIIVLDNLSSYKKAKEPFNLIDNKNIVFVNGDIRNDSDLKRVFKYDISIVYHLAAFFANQNSVDYPETSASVDVMGMLKLLEYSVLKKTDKFIFASSSCIYEYCSDLPFKETYSSYNFSTPYQAHKAVGEMYCNYYGHNYGLKIVNCRFFNSYGPGELPGSYRNVIPNFIFKAQRNLPLIITGSGLETRDYTFVYDIIQGLIVLTQNETAVGNVYNIGNGVEFNTKELAEKIVALTKSKSEIVYGKKRNWDNVSRRVASIEEIKKLGYQPLISFDEGLSYTIDWFNKSQDIISKLMD